MCNKTYKIKLTKKDQKGKIVIGDVMKSKEKTNKFIKINVKNIIIFFAAILIIVYSVIFYNIYFAKDDLYTVKTNANIEEFKISNADKIDVEEMIDINTNEGQKEEYSVEEAELEYITKYQNNPKLPKGMIQVVQEGRQGSQEITKKRIYKNDELIGEEQVSSKVTKAAINKIVDVGTGRSSSKYQVKIGDNVYVTSDRLSVMMRTKRGNRKNSYFIKK